MRELALFAGAGGGILGGVILGWRTVCAVEIEPYARAVIEARQTDGALHAFPIHDDVRTFDGWPWRGLVDVVSGGFPCQDVSVAGRGAGIDGERSGLWSEFARIIREVGPRFVFVENSPALTSRGLGRVLGDLAALGFDAEWGVLGAADVGANHRRDRIWILAHSDRHSVRDESGWREPGGPDSPKPGPDGADGVSPYATSERYDGGANAGRTWAPREPVRGLWGESGRCGQDASDPAMPRPQGDGPVGVRAAEPVPGRRCGDAPDLDRRRELQPQGRVGGLRGWPGDCGAEVGDPDSTRLAQWEGEPGDDGAKFASALGADRRLTEPRVRRVDDGLAARLDAHRWGDWPVSPTVGKLADRAARLRCLGNGQVPQCAAEAFRQLRARGGW